MERTRVGIKEDNVSALVVLALAQYRQVVPHKDKTPYNPFHLVYVKSQ